MPDKRCLRGQPCAAPRSDHPGRPSAFTRARVKSAAGVFGRGHPNFFFVIEGHVNVLAAYGERRLIEFRTTAGGDRK